ncbi:MAG: hypothetical protein C0467_03195 [Planctomycetaceae bacterium]|nr:hypothetical protein [Planctomycetaceae bacterium]
MRAALLTCSLCLLTAAQAVAQTPPVTLPPTTGLAPTLPPTGQPPALAEFTTQPPEALTGSGRPFSMNAPQMWAGAEYMLMWYNPMDTPSLIRVVPAGMAGGAGAPALSMFPSKSKVYYDGVSGVRFNLGYNFDTFGIDASGFVMGRQVVSSTLASDGTVVSVARPYTPAGGAGATPTDTDLLFSLPGPLGYSGGVSASISSQVYGFEINARRAWFTFMSDSTSVIGGLRYFDLQETLGVTGTALFPTGDSITVQDSIRTHNSFYGTQIGVSTVYGGNEPGFGFAFSTKMGIGGVNQRVDLVGTNTFVTGGVPDLQPGGLYARGLNAGSFSRGKFAYMQDVDLKFTYNFTSAFQVSFGYSLFYLSSVARPGYQIPATVNDSGIRFVAAPTASSSPEPVFAWNTHGFVIQGMTFGATFQY